MYNYRVTEKPVEDRLCKSTLYGAALLEGTSFIFCYKSSVGWKTIVFINFLVLTQQKVTSQKAACINFATFTLRMLVMQVILSSNLLNKLF